jgi:hypothetical protein
MQGAKADLIHGQCGSKPSADAALRIKPRCRIGLTMVRIRGPYSRSAPEQRRRLWEGLWRRVRLYLVHSRASSSMLVRKPVEVAASLRRAGYMQVRLGRCSTGRKPLEPSTVRYARLMGLASVCRAVAPRLA